MWAQIPTTSYKNAWDTVMFLKPKLVFVRLYMFPVPSLFIKVVTKYPRVYSKLVETLTEEVYVLIQVNLGLFLIFFVS